MHRDPKLSEPMPPGTHAEKLDHPIDSEREIELAIFKDHRFSFYYWLKWTRQLRKTAPSAAPPTLVSIDWHRDLAPPSGIEQRALENLDRQDLDEVCDFTIHGLDSHNDGHLLSAAWLNLVGDIILLKNYGMEQREEWSDQDGNNHQILEFTEFDSFQSAILNRGDEDLYLDIDLDYFVKNKVTPYQRTDVQLYDDEEIKSIINLRNELFHHLLERLEGITLATEPRYCGGVRNSNHILEVILNQLFTHTMEWKHLPTQSKR